MVITPYGVVGGLYFYCLVLHQQKNNRDGMALVVTDSWISIPAFYFLLLLSFFSYTGL